MTEQLLDVIEVQANKDYTLTLVFENHERRTFDMTPWLEQKPFQKLKDVNLFLQASLDYGTVVWPGNIDIAPETLYDRSEQLA